MVSICLYTRQLEQFISQLRLLERFIPFIGTYLAISVSFTLREYVAVRPVCGALPFLEALLLQLQILFRRQRSRCVCSIHYCSCLAVLWQRCVMNTTRVPYDHVTCLCLDLDHFTPAIFEPFQLFTFIAVPVKLSWRIGWFLSWWVLTEVLLKEGSASTQYYQSAILGTGI